MGEGDAHRKHNIMPSITNGTRALDLFNIRSRTQSTNTETVLPRCAKSPNWIDDDNSHRRQLIRLAGRARLCTYMLVWNRYHKERKNTKRTTHSCERPRNNSPRKSNAGNYVTLSSPLRNTDDWVTWHVFVEWKMRPNNQSNLFTMWRILIFVTASVFVNWLNRTTTADGRTFEWCSWSAGKSCLRINALRFMHILMSELWWCACGKPLQSRQYTPVHLNFIQSKFTRSTLGIIFRSNWCMMLAAKCCNVYNDVAQLPEGGPNKLWVLFRCG